MLEGVKPAVIEGVLSDMAKKPVPGERMSQQQIAEKWGLTFGQINSIRAHYKVELDEIRAHLISRNLGNAFLAQEILHDHLSDPVKAAKISARDVSTIAKQSQDSALNMANGMVGAPTNFNFADVKVLAKMDFSQGFKPVEKKSET